MWLRVVVSGGVVVTGVIVAGVVVAGMIVAGSLVVGVGVVITILGRVREVAAVFGGVVGLV